MVRTVLTVLLVGALGACGGGGQGGSNGGGPNQAPAFSPPATILVDEETIGDILTLQASDPDGQTVTFRIEPTADAAYFEISASGASTAKLRVLSPGLDFESACDAGPDRNTYNLTLTATDGQAIVSRPVVVTVQDLPMGPRQFLRVATGLGESVDVVGLPSRKSRVVVVERRGRIRIVDPAARTILGDFLDLSNQISTQGEKGLLGIAFSNIYDLQLSSGGVFYVLLNNLAGDLEVRRYRTVPGTLDRGDPASGDVIMQIPLPPGLSKRNGGAFILDSSGHLLIGVGDGSGDAGDPFGNAQNSHSLLGKLLRIQVEQDNSDDFPSDPLRDYRIPFQNPYDDGINGRPEIWSIGLRDPRHATRDRITGFIYVTDIGQDSVEEVNQLTGDDFHSPTDRPVNFGWNAMEGTLPFNGGVDSPSFRPPHAEYFHGTGPHAGSEVSGGVVDNGPAGFGPLYWFADRVTNNVWTIVREQFHSGGIIPRGPDFELRNSVLIPDAGTLDSIVAIGANNRGCLFRDGFLLLLGGDGELFMLYRRD